MRRQLKVKKKKKMREGTFSKKKPGGKNKPQMC